MGLLASPAIGQGNGVSHVQTEHQPGLSFTQQPWQGSQAPAPNTSLPNTAAGDGLGDSFAGFDVGDASEEDGEQPVKPIGSLDFTPALPDEMTLRVEQEPDVVAARTNVERLTQWVQRTQSTIEEKARRYEIAQGHATRLLEELDGKPEEIRAMAKRIFDAKQERAQLVRTAYQSPAATTKGNSMLTGKGSAIADTLHTGDTVRAALERADERIREMERIAALDQENFRIASTSARAALAELNELEQAAKELNAALTEGNERLGQAREKLEQTRQGARARLDAQAAAAAAQRAAQLAQQSGQATYADGTQMTISPLPANAQYLNAGWDLWRLATIDGVQQIMTCPTGHPVSFIDSWGFPRSGGRTHKGVDMMAAKGTPIYAVADGYVQRAYWNRLGGLSVNYYDSLGHKYYYAHLDEVYVTDGQQMRVGELIGTVGNTGNAASTPPHLHFQFHPNGGAPVPPYELTRSLCGPND